ncbi:hypothetical protein H2201_008786 [Coniosporium apollinis]|uniref:C2H2-type domain-containing protein n=1 Tax=Coniosporium apollinis TaxID=61459 RepID=A0ABQ9NIU5_9PEZI|nr:hypothetical protein H2201_008786 [Coniosporium apollinis]
MCTKPFLTCLESTHHMSAADSVTITGHHTLQCANKASIATLEEPVKLGPLDQLVLPFVPIALVFIYKAPSESRSVLLPAERLQRAASLLLDHYPHLTGRLHMNATDGTPEITRLGTGAALLTAQCDAWLEPLGATATGGRLVMPHLPDTGNALLAPFDPTLEGVCRDPVFTIQHTRFRCGGVALGIRLHHIVCDTAGYFQLVRDLAQLYRSLRESDAKDVTLARPPHIRSYLWDRTWSAEDWQAALDYQPSLFYIEEPQEQKQEALSALNPTLNRNSNPGPPPVVGRVLRFLRPELDALKARAADPNGGGWVSTFDALSAHLVQRVFCARLQHATQEGLSTDLSRDFLTSVNIRDILNLPPRYFSNGVLTPYTTLPHDALAHGPLWQVAKALHDSVRSLSAQDAKQTVEWIAAQPDKRRVRQGFRYENGGFTVSQWSKYDMYVGVDFDVDGNGESIAPALVSPPFTPISLVDGLAFFLSTEEQYQRARSPSSPGGTCAIDVTTHLDKKHNVPKELRNGLTRYIREHPYQFRDLSSIPIRLDGSAPHPELRVHEGYACRECKFYTASFKRMTDHLSKVHLCDHASKSRTDSLYDDVFLQTWGDGPTRNYWTVLVNGNVLRPVNLPCAHDHLESVREREQARRQEQQRADLTDTGAQTLQSTGPWMERTRWPITYQGVRRDILLRLANIPVTDEANRYKLVRTEDGVDLASSGEDEKRIWHLTQVVQVLLDRCEETMRRTSRPILCWLITARPLPCFPKPFKFLGREKSRRSYRRWLKGFVAFVFRVWRMESKIRSSLAGIQFSQKQSARMRSIWEHRLWGLRIGPDEWSRLRADYQQRQGPQGDLISPGGRAREDYVGGEVDSEAGDEDDEVDTGEEVAEDDGDEDDEEKDEVDEGREGSLCPNVLSQSNPTSELHDAAAELPQLLFELCIAFMTEEFRDGQPSSSTLVYYSGVLALLDTGETFRSA